MTDIQDSDPIETQEWLAALKSVVDFESTERAQFILKKLIANARKLGVPAPYNTTTPYVNTIPPEQEEAFPGDQNIERRLLSLIRWNAMAMVVRANRYRGELGGHISSFSSSATLYDIGFNHFFRATNEKQQGDLIYFQGHSSPGIYARAFLEGRLSEQHLEKFRQEVNGGGLSSYPHPWLMPDFWQFPTVSMGLGPIQAIYHARFLKYLQNRELLDNKNRKVWCFCGDGEMDEPESLGAISLASRENLDNLIFVINCNLQRLDGPVRGNGKIIQELEGVFRGAGWQVIKVIWGNKWDPLFEKDTQGIMTKRMEEAVDGDYQNYKFRGGAYTREHFFGKYPELSELVSDMSDDEIWKLNRGGHDHTKVYTAYAQAMKSEGRPTVIIAKTVKGYGLGDEAEGANTAHSAKKLELETIRHFRDRFEIPVSDEDLESLPFYRPAEDSPEMQYLRAQREKLGGYVPERKPNLEPLPIPELSTFSALIAGSGDREISTTMAFVRILTALTKDKQIGKRIVPIEPDEARTFGMEGMFRQLGIYSAQGQLYEPVDHKQVMYYKEDKKGQILEEGITEAGAMSSWIAAATSYANSQFTMVPFYIYYSMFGFQRIGDLAWAAGDMQAKGFLIGATAGRTTLAGEGLQHQDGHSHLLASTIPNCRAYDPAFAYELAVIIHEGLVRMYQHNDNVYYYITTMNENYIQPAMPEGVERDIIKGMYLFRASQKEHAKNHVQLLGSGAILREVIQASEILQSEYQVTSDIWSVTSFTELRKEGLSAERWNRLHPTVDAKIPYVTQCLDETTGPIIVATDYMKIVADQIRPFINRSYTVLGTDGFGRSDTREQLRKHFEVNAGFIVVATLQALAKENKIPPKIVSDAIIRFRIDPEKTDPQIA